MKKFNSHFYNTSYIRTVFYKDANDDSIFKCIVCGEITRDFFNELMNQYHFSPNSSNIIEDGFEEYDYIYKMHGFMPKWAIKKARKDFLKFNFILDSGITYEKKSIPEGYLFSGWKTGIKTKIKPEDLPKDYIRVTSFKKDGYIQTSNVSDIEYYASPFHNHAFKDDFLYIKYEGKFDLNDKKENEIPSDIPFCQCDEYIFGNDVLQVIKGIEKNSEIKEKVKEIKSMMVDQYNEYVKEMKKTSKFYEHLQEIKEIEEIVK